MKSSIGREGQRAILSWTTFRAPAPKAVHSSLQALVIPKSAASSEEEPAVLCSGHVSCSRRTPTAGYVLANAIQTSAMTTKQSTLPSGPTDPPLSQGAPRRDELSKCPGATMPLSGTE